MEILISTLLLTIVLFLNFGESNAAENQASSSGSGEQHLTVRNVGGRPRGRESRLQDGVIQGEFRIKAKFRQPVVVKYESDGFLEHMGQKIEVWLDDSKKRILKADYPGNECPRGRDYGSQNFLVRLATLDGTLQVVEYINQTGSLMGVRATRPTRANVMEPNSTQWFIVYYGQYYRVRTDPITKAVKSITIASKNEHEVVQGQLGAEVDMAGFKFVLVRGGPHAEVVGAVPLGALLHL